MKYALLWIAIGMLLGCILSECTRTPCPTITEDTVTVIKYKTDTIYPDTNKVVKKSFKPAPKKYIPNLLKPGKSYTVYQDSLVNNEVSIVVTDTVDGSIQGKNIAYRLKVPLMIIDSVFIETTITKVVEKPVPQSGLFIGAEIGTNFTMFRIAPEIEYLTKKGYAYSYNYDVLNNLHSVGIKRKLKL